MTTVRASTPSPRLLTAWAYCHVPHAFAGDAMPALEAQSASTPPGGGIHGMCGYLAARAAFASAARGVRWSPAQP